MKVWLHFRRSLFCVKSERPPQPRLQVHGLVVRAARSRARRADALGRELRVTDHFGDLLGGFRHRQLDARHPRVQEFRYAAAVHVFTLRNNRQAVSPGDENHIRQFRLVEELVLVLGVEEIMLGPASGRLR